MIVILKTQPSYPQLHPIPSSSLGFRVRGILTLALEDEAVKYNHIFSAKKPVLPSRHQIVFASDPCGKMREESCIFVAQ